MKTSSNLLINTASLRGTVQYGISSNAYLGYILRDRLVVSAVAFFDSIAFNELWSRVQDDDPNKSRAALINAHMVRAIWKVCQSI
jgi:hypothetical protein